MLGLLLSSAHIVVQLCDLSRQLFGVAPEEVAPRSETESARAGRRQAKGLSDSHAQRARSAAMRRRPGGRDRFMTDNWFRRPWRSMWSGFGHPWQS